jgi:hypothetical protein
MDITKLTLGQKKALLESLENQKSKRNTAERNTLNALREDLGEVINTRHYGEFIICGNYIKLHNFDTFGENYKARWIKIHETPRGEFFTCSYFNNKRIYLDEEVI